MNTKKSLIYPCIVILCTFSLIAGCSKHRVVEKYSGDQARNMLFNRPWLDEYPQKPEQHFMVYVFSDEEVGIHDKADSVYKHLIEIFKFRANFEKISFLFLHDNRKEESSYKIERISGGNPFNLKLTIAQDPQVNRKTYVYFSNTDWEIRNRNTLPKEVRSFSNQLNY